MAPSGTPSVREVKLQPDFEDQPCLVVLTGDGTADRAAPYG